jgi:hypothetical protein
VSSAAARSDAEIRAARLGAIGSGLAAGVAGMFVATGWILKKTWRRVLPAYWAGTGLAVAWIGESWQIPAGTVALVVLAGTGVAAGWPGRLPVRVYRATVAAVLGGFAAGTVAAGPDAMAAHPTLAVFGPCLTATILGWPWWHHLRYRKTAAAVAAAAPPADKTLTEQWAAQWQTEVVEQGICAGTRLVQASSPRPGVTEAIIRLAPGAKARAILRSGPDIETALDLDDGAVGWRRTGKAAKLGLVIVSRSYIANGVPWTGPSYRDGRCQLITFSDGTGGEWVFLRQGFGTLNGLVVGSSGAGKSRTLGVLITNLLYAGWMVVIGDPQNGQSLPAWRDAVEYHQGIDPVKLLIRRLYDEMMARSAMLSAAGVEAFDPDDPRVRKLGLQPLAAIIDECQMVLLSTDKPLIALVETLVATSRKTGMSIILATQLPQMKSLGGSVAIRDALVAGNAFIMRLSNRGSGTTILPDDFVGNPFELQAEIDGKVTAGMGYLRSAPQLGMLGRVPMLDEADAAASAPRIPVEWQAPPVNPASPMPTTNSAKTSGGTGGGAAARLRAAFGMGRRTAVAAPEPVDTPSWVLACLRKAPASAQALLDRPDCPVRQPQLYAVLGELVTAGRIIKPVRRGEPYTIA